MRVYRAISITWFSRITFILISPGYFNSLSTRSAIDFAMSRASKSDTSSGFTNTRISRPAEIAKAFSTPA